MFVTLYGPTPAGGAELGQLRGGPLVGRDQLVHLGTGQVAALRHQLEVARVEARGVR